MAMARKMEIRRERQRIGRRGSLARAETRNLARATVELKLGHGIYMATE